MAYYPIFLELKGLSCLVIGGGEVACRKAKVLLACGAKVRVVSPALGAGLKRLSSQRKIEWVRGSFKQGDLRGVALAVAATDSEPVNTRASAWARRRGVWINVVDRPALCSFILPSVVRRGRLVFAISTGGASPALAKWLRQDLQARYGKEWKRLLEGMAKIRSKVVKRVSSVRRRKEIFEKALAAYFTVLKKAVR